jgi:hypothetical protein
MASFASNPQVLGQTTPYVSQQPVQLMAQAEATMQQRHDQGVAKVQAVVDNINSLPIAKESVHKYMQEKLASYRNGLSSTLNGDFADQKVVNQVGSMINSISDDPIIANGIQATLAIRNGNAQMAEDVKKGNVNPANQTVFQRKISEYLNNPDVNSTFTGSYSTPFDVNALWLKNFKAVHPQTSLTQDAFRIGPDGKTVLTNEALNQLKTEGITPEQIQSVNNLTFSDPRAHNQLNIEADYFYGLQDPNTIAQNLHKNYSNTVKTYNDQIKAIQLNDATNKNSNSVQSAATIDGLKKLATNKLNEYNNMVAMLQRDPASAKAALYRAQKEQEYINTYAYQNTTQEIKANPLFAAQMQQANYQLKLSEFALKQKTQAFNENLASMKFAAQQAKEAAKLQGGGQTDVPAAVSETEGMKGQAEFEQTKQNAFNSMMDTKYRMLNAVSSTTDHKEPYKQNDNGQWVLNVGGDGYESAADARQAEADLWYSIYHNDYDATATPMVQKYMDELQPLERNYRNIEATQSRIDARTKDIMNNIKTSPDIKKLLGDSSTYDINYSTGTLFGPKEAKNIQLSNQDLMDAAIIKSSGYDPSRKPWQDDGKITNPVVADAVNRLSAKLKNVGAGSYGNLLEGTGIYAGKSEILGKIRQLTSAFQNNDALKSGVSSISKLYADAQQGTQTFEHVFTLATPKDRAKVVQQMSGLLGPTLDETSNKGPAKDFLELVSDNKVQNLRLSWQSQPDNSGILIARSGDETKKVHIPANVMQNAAFYKPISAFEQRFGQSLNLTKNTTTDVVNYDQKASSNKDGGRATAYTINTGNYTVKYQVQGDGSGSNYFIRGWIMDKNGKTLVNNQPLNLPNMPVWGDKSQIMNQVDGILTNDQYIQAIVQTKNAH